MYNHFKTEILKIRSYKTFWIIHILYFAIILLVISGVKLLLNFLAEQGEKIENIDPGAIPVFQFPDIWHNLTWIAGIFRIVPAIFIIISITNEISYNTLRQNIIDGLSRKDFLRSKLSLILFISVLSTLYLFILGLVMGLINTGHIETKYIFLYIPFLAGHFLEIFIYLLIALFTGLWISRAGLAMILLLLYSYVIEPIVTFRIDSALISGFFPIKAINNLIRFPFTKYALREVQDHLTWQDTGIAVFYAFLFIWLTYLILRRRDL